MRCRVTNPRTLRRLSKLTGKPIVDGLVRGNTDHRYDLVDASGRRWCYWPSSRQLEPDPDAIDSIAESVPAQ